MKIECDKCAAKYSIADEKVRGKTFKIRCKKCSNVIIVRDKGAAPAAAAAVDHAPGWHLAINGETVGPMAEDEVRQRYEAGEIDKETAIWQEGFEDWVPLGDVDVFAGLPERPAAAAEDPFTSANQDDYAAPAAVGAVAAVGGAAPMEQARSPRVSQLTGQRNENSVLFSLDSLQSLATGGGGGGAAAAAASPGAPVAARAASNPAKGLATSAPSSEGSGLIDIRALGAMVGGGAASPGAAAAPQGAADDAALPSFGGGGLGGLTSAPLIAPAPTVDPAAVAAAAPVAQQPRSQAPLYIMMAFLLLAVLGLVAFVVLREPETKIVKETVTAPGAVPSVKDSDKDDDKKDKDDDDKDDDDKDDKDKDNDDGEDGDAAADGEDAGADAAAAGMAGSSSSGSKKRKNNKKKSSGGSSGGKQASSGDPLADALGGGSSKPKDSGKSSGGGGGDPGIDCILDPSKCGSSKKKKSSPKPAAVDPSLPKTLTQADIKKGVAPHKSAGKACGSKHGGSPGEKVLVKLSISGATGSVTKAAATGKHAGTPLGNCVAQALKKAKFIKFQKSSLGVQYPIRL